MTGTETVVAVTGGPVLFTACSIGAAFVAPFFAVPPFIALGAAGFLVAARPVDVALLFSDVAAASSLFFASFAALSSSVGTLILILWTPFVMALIGSTGSLLVESSEVVTLVAVFVLGGAGLRFAKVEGTRVTGG